MNALKTALFDGAIVAKRNLIKIKRVPDLLVFSTVQPIMFVLLFAYIFGSAIEIPGLSYREFLMGGIFVQTCVFGATITGAGLADDIKKGIIDRFRSLPMARSAVLVGRTTSDLLNNALVVVIMSLTGLVVGWRIRSSVLEALGGFALRYVAPKADLGKVHGTVIDHEAFVVVPLYHPAMARYGRRWTVTLRRDFKRLAGILEGGHRGPEN